jgi:hypothetical protein
MELEELVEPDWADRDVDGSDEGVPNPDEGPVWVDAYEL